jgi:riboflavin biosynthesis pyrimidine reductase
MLGLHDVDADINGPSMSRSTAIAPLKPSFSATRGNRLPLPPRLQRLYGELRMPARHSNPVVYSNFVTTLDGIVSLHVKGHSAGADISGWSSQDRMVMGLLRAVADVVLVGSGTLAADPQHVWTAASICPELASDYGRLRKKMRLKQTPLNVVVSGSGRLDLRLPVFASGDVRALILTTTVGAERLRKQRIPASVEIRAIHRGSGAIPAAAVYREACREVGAKRILLEGGPTLLADFFAARLLSEQFLTLAPQIAGRKVGDGRPSLVMEKTFAPRRPLWGGLIDLRRGGSHLFLRYAF